MQFTKMVDNNKGNASCGDRFQLWESTDYLVKLYVYNCDYISIDICTMANGPKYLPALNIRPEEQAIVIQTTSYGALTESQLRDMMDSMEKGIQAAKSITELFLNPIKEKTFDIDANKLGTSDTEDDAYKVQQIETMLKHETSSDEEHYGARLSHWFGDTKQLNIDAGGLRVLRDYYTTHNTNL